MTMNQSSFMNNSSLPLLAPSLLAADFYNLGEQMQSCVDAGVNWFHWDIMDGHFVPNITFGPMVINSTRPHFEAFYDVHLMIEQPDRYIDMTARAGADLITVHYETTPHLHRSIQLIHAAGARAGVAINPATPIHSLDPILEDVDLILIMSVNPGFGGQTYIRQSNERLNTLKHMRSRMGLEFLIEVDGGITHDNIEHVSRSGADVLVSGSSVFKATDIGKSISELNRKARQGKGVLT